MRLTAFTDYALRVLIYLAAEPGRRATVAEIADRFDLKLNHLTKVVHFLGRQGLLANVRGKGGGIELARDAGQIVIGEVVRQTEGTALPAECFSADGGHCPITRLCALRGVLDEAVQAFYRVLDTYTLADLVRNRRALAQVLHLQPTAA